MASNSEVQEDFVAMQLAADSYTDDVRSEMTATKLYEPN